MIEKDMITHHSKLLPVRAFACADVRVRLLSCFPRGTNSSWIESRFL